MALEILTGTTLVLLTWAVALGVTLAAGRWAPIVVQRTIAPDRAWRAGVWWGLGLMTITVITVHFFAPLGGSVAAASLLGLAIGLAVLGFALRRPQAPQWKAPTPAVWAYLSSVGLAALYLAVKALGPVTNYDTGLYHLGAVKYAHDFAVIPGLATLYFPLGYSNAQFPLAAFLGNGPWDGLGYRLLNGAILMLALADLGSRLLNSRWGWGTFVLLVGLSACLVPLVGMGDGLVTSPTADTSVLILTTVSTAYLADALQRRGRASAELSVAVVLAGLLVMLRPTMAVFALLTVIVAVTLVWRRRPASVTTAFWILTSGTLLAMAMTTILRDRILSGWVFYPLSLVHFDVPWLADDPTPWRTGTLAAARDRFSTDGYVTAHSWQWVGPWLSRVLEQWEGWFLLGGLLVTAGVALVAWRVAGFPRRGRLLLAAMLPSALAVVAWFVLSPPSFRFIWGPLFALLFLPLGLALDELRRAGWRPARQLTVTSATLLACCLAVIAVTGFSAVARNQVAAITERRTWALGPVNLPYAVAPVPRPDLAPVPMSTGLVLYVVAAGNEQCWDSYPLCSYSMGDGIGLLGETFPEGFTRSR